jgi:phage terminase large subunit-like protein
MYWLPAELLAQRVHEDKIPYDEWLNQGWLRVTDGNRIDYKEVANWFDEIHAKGLYIYKIGYDSWSAQYLVDDLKRIVGKNGTEAVIQGPKTMSGPMKNLKADLEAKRINYNNSPILKWNLVNAAIQVDRNDNIALVKTSNSRKRIDGVASLIDAYVVYERNYDDYINMVG